MARGYRDLLILAAVVLAIIAGAELLFRFQSFDEVQSCFSLDRKNCVPRIYMNDLRLAAPTDTGSGNSGAGR